MTLAKLMLLVTRVKCCLYLMNPGMRLGTVSFLCAEHAAAAVCVLNA